MPFMDGSGPLGAGSMTGRGLGRCGNSKTKNNITIGLGLGLGLGLGCRHGIRKFRNNFMVNNNLSSKEVLQKQKNILEEKLKEIEEQLNEE